MGALQESELSSGGVGVIIPGFRLGYMVLGCCPPKFKFGTQKEHKRRGPTLRREGSLQRRFDSIERLRELGGAFC